MQNTIRAFIAIPISTEIHGEINKIIRGLKPVCPENLRWVNPQGIHLTLKFLGDVPKSNINQISDCMQLTVQRKNPFRFDVEGLGAFPRPDQARVLWIGLEKSLELKKLQNELDQNLNKIGFPLENREFNPHLTIARVKDRLDPAELRKIAAALQQQKTGSLGRLEVNEFSLFQSELRPGGAVYNKLFTAVFG